MRTTYYSRESTGHSTPFQNSKAPVFITADRADGRNAEGIAIYTGNARGWQDDNFVKADRIELYQKEKRMVAVNNVESALYTTKREGPGAKKETIPGMATAKRMVYSDETRLVQYEGDVKARQGSDRLEAQKVDVFLRKESNEVERMIAEGSVILVQPGKRGTGDRLVYTSDDEIAVLTGKVARVESAEHGTTMGTELTLNNRDDTILVQNRQGAGRVRSTHRLTRSN